MEKKRWLLVLALMGLLSLGGCGVKNSKESVEQYSGNYSGNSSAGMAESADYADESEEAEKAEEVAGDEPATLPDSERKLIKDVNLSVETKTFEEFNSSIRQKAMDLGGYVRNTNVIGNSYENSKANRNAYFEICIPVEKLDQFTDEIEKSGNVTSKSESVQDVTEKYVDMESRKKTLQASKERLLQLLETADSVDAIVALETKLTEVQSELESLEARLRSYDNKIAYSTIYLYINEVERISETDGGSMGQEIKARISDNMYGIKKIARSFFIWFISSLPIVLPIVAIGIGARFIYKKKIQKKHKK